MPNWTRYRGEQGVFSSCPIGELALEPTCGFYYLDDFVNSDMSTDQEYGIYVDSGCSVTGMATDEVCGVIRLNVDATDNDMAGIASSNDQAGIVKMEANSGNRVWWECRLKRSQITSGSVICGLSSEGEMLDSMLNDTQTDAAILDTSGMDFIGFLTAADTDVDAFDAVWKDPTLAAPDIHVNIAHTWVADEYVAVGLYFDGVTTLQYYVNGDQVGANQDVTETGFPDNEELLFICAAKASGGNNAIIVEIDWWRIAMEIDRSNVTGLNT